MPPSDLTLPCGPEPTDSPAHAADQGWPIITGTEASAGQPAALRCVVEPLTQRASPAWLLALLPQPRQAIVRALLADTAVRMPLERILRISVPVERPEPSLLGLPTRTVELIAQGRRRIRGEVWTVQQSALGVFLLQPGAGQSLAQRVFYPLASLRADTPAQRAAPPPRPCQTVEDVVTALTQQRLGRTQRLGELLVQQGLLHPDDLQAMLQHQRQDPSQPLGEMLLQAGLLQRQQLHGALMRRHGFPMIDLACFPIERTVLARLPLASARRLNALGLARLEGRTLVALDDPTDDEALRELGFIFGSRIIAATSDRHSVGHLVPTIYERFQLGGAVWHG